MKNQVVPWTSSRILSISWTSHFIYPKSYSQNVEIEGGDLQWCWGKLFQKVFFARFREYFLQMCHTVLIFSLTQRTRLDGPFRYLEHGRAMRRKNSRGHSKKVLSPKMGFSQHFLRARQPHFETGFFKKYKIFHFFLRKIRLVCRTAPIFNWRQEQG